MYIKLELTNRQYQELKNVAWKEEKEIKVVVCEMIFEFAKQVEKHGWDYFTELKPDYSNYSSIRDYIRTEGMSISWEAERVVIDYANKYRVFQHVPIDVAVAYCTYSKTNRRGLSFYGQKKFDDISNLRCAANTLSKYPDLKSAAESASIFADNLESLSDEEYEEQYAPKVESSGG